jgi:2-keto-4-pentenoate hydratase/2-oxohepta-3-ene-1,7-dioic acid hydratase in catechol pathway
MKLLRYGLVGREKPGLMDAAGNIRDLSAYLPDITASTLAPQELKRLAAVNVHLLPIVADPQRFGVPIVGTRQFIAVGLNYSDHAAESKMPVPKEPILFTKAVSCIQGPDDDVRKPRDSTKMDWEVELGIVMGTHAAYVTKERALEYVSGYVVCHDVSERGFQFDRGGTWDKGKGCETFGPTGPWLVTKDEIDDVQKLDMWLDVNGQRMQSGNTKTMIFDCATLVSYISQFVALLPGDIITTGTPPGVGMGKNPPTYLNVGDVVELGIDKLGTQRHRIISWDFAR